MPEGGSDGTYPIKITKPAEWVGKLMPFMKAGLKVMTVANGALSVAQCFFPGVPTIPASIRSKAKTAVGALDKESSVAEFDALSETLTEASSGNEEGKTKDGQRGAALREFQRFLEENDAKHTFCGLHRTVFKTGERAGTAVWTLEEDEAVINAICAASSEKRANEELRYEEVAAMRQRFAELEAKAGGGGIPLAVAPPRHDESKGGGHVDSRSSAVSSSGNRTSSSANGSMSRDAVQRLDQEAMRRHDEEMQAIKEMKEAHLAELKRQSELILELKAQSKPSTVCEIQ